MVLLYIVAWSILLCFAHGEEVTHGEGHSRHTYPDPLYNHRACNRKARSYICDPDNVILESEADQLNQHLTDIVNELSCPCSRYSCIHHKEGYKIGIALTGKIIPGEEFDESGGQELSEREWEERRQEWLLNEAKLFAHAVLAKWSLGRCKEDVVVLYSLHDGVLYTAVGDVARMKLNGSVVQDVSLHAQSQFGRGGSIFKGLLKMVKDYRNVFEGSYVMGKPRPSETRSSAVSVTKRSGSLTAEVMLLLLVSITSMMLCHGGTQ